MRLTMSVINQDEATSELPGGNWTEYGYRLPEWFGASVSFAGYDLLCFSCMGLSEGFCRLAHEVDHFGCFGLMYRCSFVRFRDELVWVESWRNVRWISSTLYAYLSDRWMYSFSCCFFYICASSGSFDPMFLTVYVSFRRFTNVKAYKTSTILIFIWTFLIDR